MARGPKKAPYRLPDPVLTALLPDDAVRDGVALCPTGPVDSEALLQRALNVIAREVDNYSRRPALDSFEAQALNAYVRTLLTVISDQRKMDDADLEKLTDEQIEQKEREILARRAQ